MPRLTLTAIVLCLMPAGALAQTPVPRPWTGFYLGAGVGAGAVTQVQSFNVSGFGTVLSESSGGQGLFGTVTAGYDYRIVQHWVAGAFVDYDVSGISSDNSGGILFSYPFDHKRSWSVGARVGFLATPTTMWYLAGGYTQARFDFETIGGIDFNGYFVGGGVEMQIGGNWLVRGEYRFAQLQTETLEACGCGSQDAEPSVHTGRVLLIYRFGGGTAP